MGTKGVLITMVNESSMSDSEAMQDAESPIFHSESKSSERVNPLSLLLMSGHICVDMVQGGIAAVIPFLVLQNGFLYAEATMLVFAANIASAVIQPVFGWLGDKVARPWLMAGGVLLAGVGMAGIGLLSDYWMVVGAALLSGIGNAMLHPEGGRLAYLVGGDNKAQSMSVFSVGGQIGFCVGPVITVAAVTTFGLVGMTIYLALCLPVALVLLRYTKRFESYGVRDTETEAATCVKDRWGAFSLVLGACSARSIVFYGITSFVPLILVASFAVDESFASSMITAFAAVGAVATLASGKAAQRIPIPWLMIGCFVVLIVALTGFIVSPWMGVSIGLLMVFAICLNLFNPAAVTLGQHYLPQHLGIASGLTFGVAVAVGGVAAPLLGLLGDAIGLTPIMLILTAVGAGGLAVSLGLLRIR